MTILSLILGEVLAGLPVCSFGNRTKRLFILDIDKSNADHLPLWPVSLPATL